MRTNPGQSRFSGGMQTWYRNSALTRISGPARISHAVQLSMAAKRYDESSVKKLRGIEPVQRLPGMYTRTSDPTHIIQEAIDTAADEAFGEHADRIDVTV